MAMKMKRRRRRGALAALRGKCWVRKRSASFLTPQARGPRHQGSRLARFWQAGMGDARFAWRGEDPRAAQRSAKIPASTDGSLLSVHRWRGADFASFSLIAPTPGNLPPAKITGLGLLGGLRFFLLERLDFFRHCCAALRRPIRFG
jgi:hypothetical protein